MKNKIVLLHDKLLPYKRIIFGFASRNNSIITFWLIVLGIIYINYLMAFWNEPKKIIGSDTASYYTYLPAVFIYNDLDLNFYDENEDYLTTKVYFRILPDGQKIIQTSYGLSFIFSPFFFASHLYSYCSGDIMDGYSPVYKIGLIFSSIFYFSLGLYFLRKILLKYYSQWVTSITLLVVGIGTNLLHYVIVEPAMSHAYSFSLIILFLYFTIRWHNKQNLLNTIGIGLIGGLIVLIRPSNILVMVLFIFWNVDSINSLKQQFFKFFRFYYLILLIIVIGVSVWIPQFFYWKYITGHYLYFSYGDRAYFFWGDPEITNVLFSYRKGWLIYTPLMSLALIGLFFMIKYNRKPLFPVLLFTTLNIYLLASWCFWWFGGSFGSRGFIDSYGIMALPIASFFTWGFRQKIYLRFVLVIVSFVLIYFNTFQVRQYYNGAIHWSDMTKEAYWETFLKLHRTKRFPSLLKPPPYEKVKKEIRKAKGKSSEENK